jgi:hypothetical protein
MLPLLQLAIIFPFDPDKITPELFNSLVLTVIKILFLIGFGLYVVFAFLATRQIEEMRNTVITTLSSLVRVIVYAHLVLAIGFFLFALLYLP